MSLLPVSALSPVDLEPVPTWANMVVRRLMSPGPQICHQKAEGSRILAIDTYELKELHSIFLDLESNFKLMAVAITNSTNAEGERS